MMRVLLFTFLLFGFMVSCQQKKASQDKNESKDQSKEQPEEKSKKPPYRRTIENIYNYKAYQQQKNVSVDLRVINDDTTNIQIYLKPGRDLQLVKKNDAFLYINGDSVYEKPVDSFNNAEISLYQNLAQAYQVPYDLDNFQMSQTNDTLQLNSSTTLKRSYHLSGKRDITLFLSPKTDLIKSVVFNNGTDKDYLIFNVYITVQEIPISMRWTTYKNTVINQQAESLIKVRKIRYPESLAFDFELPEKAKPIQDN